MSVNSRSQLLNNETSAHDEYSLQQYEPQRFPASSTVTHAIRRKPLPAPSTPPYLSTLDQADSSRNASVLKNHGFTTENETLNTLDNGAGEDRRDDEISLGHQVDSESLLQGERQTQEDHDIAEHNHHLSTSTQSRTIMPLHTQKAQPKSSFVHRFWLWEVAASALSLACMASIIGVLSYEQGRRLDQWGLGKGFLSPTVVVSFLGTLAKSACLLVLAEVISQLKWLHYQDRPQKLSDIQLFDNASRGPWGAFKLASIRNRKTLLASFASALVVVSMLVDPFIQSVFRLPVILTPVEGVRPGISQTRVYDPSSLAPRFGQCYGAAYVEPKMQAAILAPIWNTTLAPSLPCTFERCHWPTIHTLGVCSSCENLTHTVVPTCTYNAQQSNRLVDCNYTVPSRGIVFNAVFAKSGSSSTFISDTTVWNSLAGDEWRTTIENAWHFARKPSFIESHRAVISNFTFVKFSNNIDPLDHLHNRTIPPVSQAMHCRLELCARTFTTPQYANFSAAPLTGFQTPLVTTLNGTTMNGSTSPAFIGLRPDTPGQVTDGPVFQINYCDYHAIGQYLQSLFTTTMSTTGVVGTTNDTGGGGVKPYPDITPRFGMAFSRFEDFPELMNNVSNSMTEAFRISANKTVLEGVATSSVTYIEIVWPRLILPISLIILTSAVLIITIVRNKQRGMPSWKSSSLALLFHELDGWGVSETQTTGPEEVEGRAKGMNARVINSGGKLSFSKAEWL